MFIVGSKGGLSLEKWEKNIPMGGRNGLRLQMAEMCVLEVCDSDNALGTGCVLENSVQASGSTGVSEARCQPDEVLSNMPFSVGFFF